MTDETLPPLWNPDTDDSLVCVGVRRETHDVLTFVLAADPPRRFAFRPGQFMTYGLEIGGETVNRCYTISSPPTRPDRISLTVKAVPGGPVSNWLHANLKPGTRLSALGPTCAWRRCGWASKMPVPFFRAAPFRWPSRWPASRARPC